MSEIKVELKQGSRVCRNGTMRTGTIMELSGGMVYVLWRHGVGGWIELDKVTLETKRNATRRERHQAMLDMGLNRVKGALGGVCYE